jgi:SAM-dependent methyltransferase
MTTDWTFKPPSYSEMKARFQTTMPRRGWKHAAKILSSKTPDYSNIEIADVGCGTGTFALLFGLLGAKVVLIDNDKNVLETAKKIYEMWGVKAEFHNLSCINTPPEYLLNRFDMVSSGGLAEHFTGEDRIKCVSFHYKLLKKGGFTYIGVPNKISPFYQTVISFRRLTGTFGIELEVPFSHGELIDIGRKAGFDRYYVLGNEYIRRDCKEYALGMISAFIDIFPDKVKKTIRSFRNKVINQESCAKHENPAEIILATQDIIRNRINVAKTMLMPSSILADRLSAGLVLFGFRDK